MSNINEHVYVIPGVTEVTKPHVNSEFQIVYLFLKFLYFS